MKNLKRCTALFMVAAIFVFGFASCETETDDGNYKKPVATVTAVPEVSAADIEAGAETALISAGTASLTSSGDAITRASAGTKVYVKAVVPSGKRFGGWQPGAGVTLADPSYPTTYFTMPSSDVTVTAQFLDVYTVTVENGYAYDSVAVAGATVNISANNPASGKKFDKWVSSSAVTFENENSQNTSFTMIAENVTVTATYKDAAATILDHPTMYGDVVFSNGKACSYNEVQYLTAEQIADVCGVVFKIEEGKAWILSLEESSTTCAWAQSTPAESLVGTSLEDGAANMAKFNSTDFPFYDYIAGLAGTNAITGQITDWYLPAKSELEALGQNSSTVHVALAYLDKTSIMGGKYWSSSEDNASRAWYLNSNTMSYYSKTVYAQCKCRAIKVISTE